MEITSVSFQATDPAEFDVLLPELRQRLSEQAPGPVEITVAQDVLTFRARTWPPLLRVRVEEALESVLGMAWLERFDWTS